MSEVEARFKDAYDAILEEMPDPPLFDDFVTTVLSPNPPRRTPVAVVVALGVVVVLAIGGVGVLLTTSGTYDTYTDTEYDTYTDTEGGVWIKSDCPAADQLLYGDPDGLPHKGNTDLDRVEALVGDSGRTAVVPRNGEVWEREADGSITVTTAQDYMIEARISDASKCPPAPMFNNGVPLVFKIESTVSTYADELGLIWYATDCPDADVLLFAGADALPPRERTELEAVEAMAEQSPEYRVIPRNGWVWEKLSDGSVVVIQVEDYMLERTIESAEQCPNVPSNNGGIAVAYRITSD